MRVLPRTQFGNPILRKKAKKVSLKYIKSTSFKNLIKRMFFTMRRVNGVGLAAPQIGRSMQLAVVEVYKNPNRPRVTPFPKTAIINPKILYGSKEKEFDYEGCLSFENVRGRTPRHESIKVRFWDEKGIKHIEEFSGFIARVFQHEIDHLNGIVYVDRMRDMKTLMTVGEYRKRILKTKK